MFKNLNFLNLIINQLLPVTKVQFLSVSSIKRSPSCVSTSFGNCNLNYKIKKIKENSEFIKKIVYSS